MICLNRFVAVLGMTLVLAAAVFTFGCNAAETVVISFEQEEGFPAAGGDFTGKGIPTDVVAVWTNDSAGANVWFTDDGPGGVRFPEAPPPVSGTQIAGFGEGGVGINIGTMHLNDKSNLTLISFYWAYRGNGNSRPGGDAWLELEYFDIYKKSIGKEKFQGGLAPDWNPKFELVRTSPQFQDVPLSKVIFRGVPPDPSAGHGTFFLDDVTLEKRKPKPMLSLVKDGKPVSTIVLPKAADSWTEKSAQWLQEYLQKSTGARIEIVTEDKVPSGTLISVGHTEIARKAGINVDDLKWDGCKIVVKEDVLYLIGRDNWGTATHDYIGARGTCRAVLVFLEEFCGVRWFLPSLEGELVPKAKDIYVPKDLAKTSVPAFAYSDGRSVYDVNVLDEPGKSIAALANNYRKGVKAAGGGHRYYAAVPAEKYFKEHPEYFALINGKRTGEGNHLCSTNPDVKRLLLEYLRMRLDQGWEWEAIGQEDGYARCECPECEKMDDYRYESKYSHLPWEVFQSEKLKDAPCDRVFFLHKWVIDEVAKSHPDKKVLLMCYAPTAWPSKKIPYFGDNVIAELMNVDAKYIEAWSGKVAGLAGYTYWFNTQCPMGMDIHMTPREVAKIISFLHKNGFVGLSVYPEANWGLEGPMFYMLGKLMGDPNQDYISLIEEYCHGVYGKAGDTMIGFFNRLYDHLEKVLPPIDASDISADGRNTKLPRGINTTEMFLRHYPPIFLKQLEEVLQKAEREADTEQAQGWVRLTRDMFDFTKMLTHMLISYRAYQADGSRENWLELKQRVEAFDAYRMKIITYPKAYTDVWFPGHGEFCKWMTGDQVSEAKNFYVSWEEKRKPEVLQKGIKGMAMGYGAGYYHSFIKEPLTLDFSKEPVFE